MRTTCVLALVASLMIMTGCCSINGPGCGNGCGNQGGQWNGFCSEGSGCGGGCDHGGGGFALPSFGLGRGCDGGGCDSGGRGTSANFSDLDCGPMCGAYLSEDQFGTGGGGCACDSCQVGQSYAKRTWNSFGKGMPRPCFSRPTISWPSFSFPRPFAGLSSKLACWGSGLGASAGDGVHLDSSAGFAGGCDSGGCDPCNSYGCGDSPCDGGASCHGLGSTVGCDGCAGCGGGNAIGQNHSDYSNGAPGAVAGGEGLAARQLGSRVGSLRGKFGGRLGGPGRSRHPYGGELPHTGSADEAAIAGGSSAPSYAYPYYTTRGPRDFLQDGCGPPPVYPYSPRTGCLPSIGR